MLQFRILGFPVKVEWTFWLVTVLLGSAYASIPGPRGITLILTWVAVVFCSIIWHELGHALARKRFGASFSELRLYSFGGLCSGPGRFTRTESMIISAAGPAANLALGVLIWATAQSPLAVGWWMPFFVSMALWINVGWAILNLLPIPPLDGGRIMEAAMANRNPSLPPKIGLVVAAIAAVLGLTTGNLWTTFLFGYLAYSNYQRIKGFSVRLP